VSALQESPHSEHVMALACAVKSGTAGRLNLLSLSQRTTLSRGEAASFAEIYKAL